MRIHTVRSLIAAVVVALVSPGGAAALGDTEMKDCLVNPGLPNPQGFIHQTRMFIDDTYWYFVGPENELAYNQVGQPQDMPGHCWKGTPDFKGLMRFFGMHFNTGPLGGGGLPRFWSSTAGDHEQLYWVDLIISEWTPEIAVQRMKEGYVHYHELVQSGTGCKHPTKVAWLRHTAILDFTFDGGPPQVYPDTGYPFRPRNVPHVVHPGVDHAFPPVYDIPYQPEIVCEGIKVEPTPAMAP